jgi:hypothetical protein
MKGRSGVYYRGVKREGREFEEPLLSRAEVRKYSANLIIIII